MSERSEIVSDYAKFIITYSGNDDEMQVTKTQAGGLRFEINEPWAGDTQGGFGATTSIHLEADDMKTFLKWLVAA